MTALQGGGLSSMIVYDRLTNVTQVKSLFNLLKSKLTKITILRLSLAEGQSQTLMSLVGSEICIRDRCLTGQNIF